MLSIKWTPSFLRAWWEKMKGSGSRPALSLFRAGVSMGVTAVFIDGAYLEVRLGKLAFRGMSAVGNPVFQQKRVGLMLGVDMALLAGKNHIGKMALLSGDSDFTPAVEAVKREGVLATLWHGSHIGRARPSRELLQIADERRELTPEIIRSVSLRWR